MLSIIICSINDEKFAAVSKMYARLLPAGSFEIIRIPDAKSMAEGYNRGIKQSRGEQLLFCHDDIEILSENLAERLSTHLKSYDLIGVAGTSRLLGASWIASGPPKIYGQVCHPQGTGGWAISIYNSTHRAFPDMQALDGVFLAMHRRVVEAIPFDEILFDGFHLYDIDFTFAAYQAGFKLAVCCDIQLMHASGGTFDADWRKHAERFKTKYEGKIPRWTARQFLWGRILVHEWDAVMDIMTPSTWETIEGKG